MSDRDAPPPERDRREARRDERWERPYGRPDAFWGRYAPLIGGVVLIFLGVVFLLRNLGYPIPRNWWAVFILVPAFAAFNSAWSMYRRNGRQVTPPVTGAAIGGLILTGIAIVFLLGLDLGLFWPLILILLGVAALSGGIWRRPNRPPD